MSIHRNPITNVTSRTKVLPKLKLTSAAVNKTVPEYKLSFIEMSFATIKEYLKTKKNEKNNT